MNPLRPTDLHHLRAAEGWLELGNHVAAFDELEEIEPKLRGHPEVLEVRWRIYEMADKWDYCIEIGNALVKMKPDDLSCWIRAQRLLGCLAGGEMFADQRAADVARNKLLRQRST